MFIFSKHQLIFFIIAMYSWSYPPSHIHCSIPGSKLTFSTNLVHHSLLARTHLDCLLLYHPYLKKVIKEIHQIIEVSLTCIVSKMLEKTRICAAEMAVRYAALCVPKSTYVTLAHKRQEAQLMLTTGSTPMTLYILGVLVCKSLLDAFNSGQSSPRLEWRHTYLTTYGTWHWVDTR